ncbi:unnamed protein product [Adineta steineri]|uniref:ETS domain-containing protein n=1 Tax=Adineta steineri TaxID=433720 RepID=A0A814IUA4_9BILA|nr:unnamed protein product [Adineta steineri]CAF4233719.1 unnamed protein product [Adineta steineri]
MDYRNKSSIFDDDDNRTTMITPEPPTSPVPPDNDMFIDIPSPSEPTPPTTSTPIVDGPTQPSTDSQVIEFNRDEWRVIDSKTGKQRSPRQHEFLRLLLENPRYCSYATWLDESQGLFTFLLPEEVAELWSKVKNRQTGGKMDYSTFSRGLRYYYKEGVMTQTHKRYTFCFKPDNK